MNRKQLAEHIGNIDDRLVAQAEHIPNYAALRRRKWVRQLLATAAVLALMISSFSVGALAFARETVVEVPAEQKALYRELMPEATDAEILAAYKQYLKATK